MAIQKVLIIGAGPCGLLLALLLAKNGMTVEVLDKESRLDDSPRAAYYNWPAMVDLYRAGLGEDLRHEAWYARSASWRTMQNERLFGLKTDEEQEKELLEEEAKGRPRPAVLPLRDLMRMMQKHIEQQERVKLSFNHIVTGIGQDDSNAWVHAELIDGSAAKLAADYVVGCDGANSVIRRSLFGEKAFPGFTWPQTIVATNVYYDFYSHGCDDVNYFIDPENGFLAAKLTDDNFWRVSYGDITGLSEDEYRERVAMKYESILPGNPKPGDYKLMAARPYRCHQRLAEAMRVGRFLLAGDSAHLTNPFGGLGLTGGICDVGSLADCLTAIHRGQATADKILDVYNDVRRRIFSEIVNPTATENMRLVYSDPAVAKESSTGKLFLQAEKDRDLERSMRHAFDSMRYDFSPHFDLLAPNQPASHA
ncbi:hypothetical protein NLU13_4914 [Sarocladium strictum]|uniref:FAD-binding domain-containing protein n=1 Tax=Sarocladium strictum TaxID=5046 RepID=A0AA39GK43_SARSR|nr:hypothetical protein NLU13_4914 [Sarocladium strictum]